jgi:hypothetical protein
LSITEIIKSLQKEIGQQRQQEREILGEIAAVETMEFAERAAKELDPTTHAYSFEAYLTLLENLRVLLSAGMPPDLALDSVQAGWDIDKLLYFWRKADERL